MLGLTAGEFGLVASIVLAIVTARYFPTFGERLMLTLGGKGKPDAASPPMDGPTKGR